MGCRLRRLLLTSRWASLFLLLRPRLDRSFTRSSLWCLLAHRWTRIAVGFYSLIVRLSAGRLRSRRYLRPTLTTSLTSLRISYSFAYRLLLSGGIAGSFNLGAVDMFLLSPVSSISGWLLNWSHWIFNSSSSSLSLSSPQLLWTASYSSWPAIVLDLELPASRITSDCFDSIVPGNVATVRQRNRSGAGYHCSVIKLLGNARRKVDLSTAPRRVNRCISQRRVVQRIEHRIDV